MILFMQLFKIELVESLKKNSCDLGQFTFINLRRSITLLFNIKSIGGRMKKSLIYTALLSLFSLQASAKLIQHTEQIAEVQFNGSSYELGQHVADVAGAQILDSIDRFNNMLGVMLPGLNVVSISKSFESKDVFTKLEKSSPDAAAYIKGLAKGLNRTPELLLSVAMSDEAILESQSNGGMGFLQADVDSSAPARCTVMAKSDQQGSAWGAANFDYMGINYTGLIVLHHTDTDGKTRVIQTWAGLIPYGGISKGGQMVLMNTLASDGTAREKDKGEIISDHATPSFYLSWDAYNIEQPKQVIDMVKNHDGYTAFFSYIVADGNNEVVNIENGYKGAVRTSTGPWKAHANHSTYQQETFVDESFAAHSLTRQAAADKFMPSATGEMAEAQNFLGTKPLWKGRGELMGTVTSTYMNWTPTETTMYIQTDKSGDGERTVVINNHFVVKDESESYADISS